MNVIRRQVEYHVQDLLNGIGLFERSFAEFSRFVSLVVSQERHLRLFDGQTVGTVEIHVEVCEQNMIVVAVLFQSLRDLFHSALDLERYTGDVTSCQWGDEAVFWSISAISKSWLPPMKWCRVLKVSLNTGSLVSVAGSTAAGESKWTSEWVSMIT